jgi:hypothetical protein
MVISLLIVRHTAADCPINNEKVGKVTLAAMSKMDELTKKHEIKVLGAWSVHPEHMQILVFEAASYEALQAFNDEPLIRNMMNWYTTEVLSAETMETSIQRIMQAWA